MTEINVRPNGHYLLVELVHINNMTKSGIYLGDTTREQAGAKHAKVLAVGPTAFMGVDGCNPMDYPTGDPRYKMKPHQIWGIEIGDTIIFNRYEGVDVSIPSLKNQRLMPDTVLVGAVQGDFEITKADF